MFALLVAVLLTAEPSAKCATDADCVLSVGCECGCCPALSKALTKEQAEAVRRRCATLGECDAPRGCANVDCKADAPGAKAVCKAGACVKVEPPKPECLADANCTMARDCTCDCCPAPYEPMTKAKADALRVKCSRLGPCGKDPQKCAGEKCTTSNAGAAVCREGKCARGGK